MPRRLLLTAGFLTLHLAAACGCEREAASPMAATSPAAQTTRTNHPLTPAATQAVAPEEWAAQTPEGWPQLVLTHSAEFEGHTPLRGASGFLIRAPDGRVLAATAKHVIEEAGGVNPPIAPADLDSVVRSWVMHPRTRADRTVRLHRLTINSDDAREHDWLLMTIEAAGGGQELPARPLPVRREPVQAGESVFLVGVPYSNRNSSQEVYRGTVTRRAREEDLFEFTISPPVDLRGFSGAPILDAAGRAVGLLRGTVENKGAGEPNESGVGEDIATALDLLKE